MFTQAQYNAIYDSLNYTILDEHVANYYTVQCNKTGAWRELHAANLDVFTITAKQFAAGKVVAH